MAPGGFAHHHRPGLTLAFQIRLLRPSFAQGTADRHELRTAETRHALTHLGVAAAQKDYMSYIYMYLHIFIGYHRCVCIYILMM